MDLSWWYFGRYPLHNESRARRRFGASFESFRDYARILEPIFQEFSTVPFSLAHCGTARTWEDYPHIFKLMAEHPNLSCDLAAIGPGFQEYRPAFIRRLVKAVGARKVMYGSDVPHRIDGHPDTYRTGRRRWTLIADECPFLNDEEKQLILAGNAERFVRNELPESS